MAIKDAKKAAESQSTDHHEDVPRSGGSNKRVSHLIFVNPGNASGMHTALSSIMARRPCTKLQPHSAVQEVVNVQANSKAAWMLMLELLLRTELLLMLELLLVTELLFMTELSHDRALT